MYVFYLDVFFLRNLCLNGLILLFSFYVMKIPIAGNKKELLFGAVFGAGLEAALLLLCDNYGFFVLVSQCILMPVILFAVLGKHHNISRKRLVIFTYMVIFLFGGVTNAMENLFGLNAGTIIGIFCAIMVTEIIVAEIQKNIQLQKYMYRIELGYQDRVYSGLALYDSGNHLCEPWKQREVHIVSGQVIQRLKMKEPSMMIPYQSLGNVNGILEVYEADWLKISLKDQLIEYQKVLLGKAEEELLKNKQYQIILNEKVGEMEYR